MTLKIRIVLSLTFNYEMIFSCRIFMVLMNHFNSATLRNIIVGMLFILGIQGPWITQTLENTNFGFTRFQEMSSIKCNYSLIVMH